MLPLVGTVISELVKMKSSREGAYPLCAIEFEDSVIVTDNSMLFEWPKDQVDLESSQYRKLLLSADAHGSVKERFSRYWREWLIVDGDLVEAVEAHPLQYELDYFHREGGTVVFNLGPHRYYYHPVYHDMIWFLSDGSPTCAVYLPGVEDNTSSFLAYLCLVVGGMLVGVVCNQRMQNGGDVLCVDEASGKVAVIERSGYV